MRYNILITCALLFILSCGSEVNPKEAFAKGNYAVAFPIWQVKAEQGDMEAQNFMGIHYFLGLGVKRNFLLARQWYEKAARRGYPDAQRNLGLMYEAGYDLPRDFENAFLWLYAAHRQGNQRANVALSNLMTKLSVNQIMIQRERASKFIIHDVLGEETDDYGY